MKILKIIGKLAKWYLIADLLLWSFVGTKELWRKDIEEMGWYSGLIRLLKEGIYTWKYGKYVRLNKED